MVELAQAQPGGLGVESVRGESGLGESGLGITVSYWQSLDSIRPWREHVEHRLPVAQLPGGAGLRICEA